MTKTLTINILYPKIFIKDLLNIIYKYKLDLLNIIVSYYFASCSLCQSL